MKPVTRADIHQIGTNLYRIPQDFRPDMRVPAHFYADEGFLSAALEDRSLEQLVNTATLPGIVGQAMAMPDIHQGYGFPIGGVAATLLPHGVVSPGGVGYDINCLSGNSRVAYALGYTRTIADMEVEWEAAQVACCDLASHKPTGTRIMRYLKRPPCAAVLAIRTEAGDRVIATADHPFWTPRGMIEAGRLTVGQRVGISPFEGVPFDQPAQSVLITDADILALLAQLGKGSAGNATGQVLNQLYKRNLLPLRSSSHAMPHLIRIAGFVFGDGHIHFEGGNGKGVTWFYGEPEDLEEIRRDVGAVGFTPSRVYVRERQHQVTTAYRHYEFSHSESSFKVVGSAFALMLAALGVPVGNKTEQDFEVPGWLFGCPAWQRRLFLAALFGAELAAPRVFDERCFNFYTPILSVNKRAGNIASGREFLAGIARLLQTFGVIVNKISEREEQTNPDGSVSHRLRLVIGSDPDNLVRLWGRISYDYNGRKRALAAYATQYLKRKLAVWQERREAAKEAVAMRAAGASQADIFGALATTHAHAAFLEHSLYRDPNRKVRAGREMESFPEYCEWATDGLGQGGLVWEHIVSIEPVNDVALVYDFTVEHSDHNFIANSFVVSNCGVRLLAANAQADELRPYLPKLADALYRHLPSGVGVKGHLHTNKSELEGILRDGSQWAAREGYARPEDVAHTEERGRMAGANPDKVSKAAKERGLEQVGTLGSGNHFAEIDEVTDIFDAEAAALFGLRKGQVVFQIHCGSRGLGHQVATDYIEIFQRASKKYGYEPPDRQLVCAPLDSPEGEAYLAAMNAAANYAWANRQVLTYQAREAFEEVLKGKVANFDLRLLYDVAHNMAKIETHAVGGKQQKVCVHRKGATRAFGPGHPDVPEDYRALGQPVLVPGSMGTASYVLVGTAGAMQQTFGSCCHGAGRTLSRAEAKRQVRGEALRGELEHEGIVVRAGSLGGLAEEAPQAYKSIDRVVAVVESAGIARIVARVEPLAVMKG